MRFAAKALGALAAAVALLGNKEVDSKKIIGGDEAVEGRYPYFTSVFLNLCGIFGEYGTALDKFDEEFFDEGPNKNDPNMQRLKEAIKSLDPEKLKSKQDCPDLLNWCGGSLIAPNAVLTAAHCFLQLGDGPKQPSYVRVGNYDEINSAGEGEYRVKEWIIHPDRELTTRFDLMILILEEDVQDVEPVTLYLDHIDTSLGSPDLSEIPSAIGFGLANLGDNTNYEYWNFPQILQEVDLKLVDDQRCTQSYASHSSDYEYFEQVFRYVKEVMICAVDAGKGVCNGDSGGPLFFKHGPETDLQFGVVSWGGFCGTKGNPGVFGRLSASKDWIVETVPDVKIYGEEPYEATSAPTGDEYEFPGFPEGDDDNGLFILVILLVVVLIVLALVIVFLVCYITKSANQAAARSLEYDLENELKRGKMVSSKGPVLD